MAATRRHHHGAESAVIIGEWFAPIKPRNYMDSLPDCNPTFTTFALHVAYAMAWAMDDGYELDTGKIDDTVLALLSLTMCGDDRAWKGHDWDTLSRLHDKGMICDPVGKAKSVALAPEGMQRCEELFDAMFVRRSR